MTSDEKAVRPDDSGAAGEFMGFILAPSIWLLLFYSMVFWIVPALEGPLAGLPKNLSGVPIFLSAGLMSLTALLALWKMSSARLDTRLLWVLFLLGILTDIGINQSITQGSGTAHHSAFINLSLLGLTLSGGILVSRLVERATYILPLSVIAGIADIWSVFAGVTKKAVESKVALNYALFSYPVPGFGIRPLVGATDFLFAVLYMSLARRFGFSLKKNLTLLALSFLISIAIAIISGVGIPVLPVMALFIILGNWSQVKVTDPKELRESLTGIVLIVVALTVITLVRR